ncbi:titin isoform X2 [Pogonomyrmex barbatus]|uniref:glycogenin glucosyltransferase n=1 Tax=Pogonomyrmex barbatus TaxID=144034 RepID=A0A6I9WJ51_9HYME|nr:titin isoform X2 [Pogonomyrmex barbatus]
MGGYAWVTLATNDAYSLGALVLAHSLRRVGTKHELACLITPGVTAIMREKLAEIFSFVQEVNVLDSKDEANLALLARPELGITFTKLHCWRLTQYEKCVFVDADTLVVRNCDELFEREELSAAPDVGWPDCFNSGVFVFRPSQQTFASIIAFAAAKGSFDGGDQGLLNMYFSDWATKDISKHLPFIYNMCSTATYSYLPAFKQFGDDVRIIHFIGITKPWLQYFDTLTGTVQPPPGSAHLQSLLQLWWNIFCERVHPQLTPSMAGIAGALAQITLGEARSAEQIALEEHMRKQSWEQGQIDYMGRDSFDNIWKKICETLSLVPQRQLTPPKEDIAISEPAVTQTVDASVSVEVEKSAVEADKDPTQCLVCEIPKEEKLPMAQIPEQEAPVLPSGESVTVETAATKVASEPVQLEAVCVKPTTESKDVKVCEIEVPPPKLPVEPLPAKIISECKLASPQATQETAPQSESLLETKEPQQTDLQVSTYLLADAVCKLVQVATPVAKIDDTSAPIEAKPETPTSVVPDATQSATLISPQVTVPSVASEAPMEDAAKRVVESMPDVTQPLTIDPSERHAEMLLAASEISTVSPVPIQVAESVLQAEPKESVLDAAVTVSDQAIATTVTAVHEFTDVASVPTPVESVQLNGSACEAEKRGDVTTMAAIIPDTPEKTDAPMTTAAVIPDIPEKTDVPAEVTKASILLTTKNVPSEPPKVTEEKILGEVVPSEASSVEKLAEQVARTEAKSPEQMAKIEETKPAELIIKMETTETKPPEQKIEAMKEESVVKTEVAEAIAKQPETITQAEPALEAMPTKQAEVAEAERLPSQVPGSPIQVPGSPIQVPGSPIQVPGSPTQIPESPTQVPESPTQVPKSPIAEQSSPMESIEAKPSSIPLTPMVTEAPSPSVESTQEAEETAKKSLKKSDSAEGADGESADKKGAKKAVKKVTKKPKTKADEAVSSTATEGVTADSSQKAKKTVKTTKKIGTKTLETDTSVPETPPPSSADAVGPDTPVPPKRKTKSTNAKGTTGKKEAEE